VLARAQSIAAKGTVCHSRKWWYTITLSAAGSGAARIDYVEKAVRIAQKVDGPSRSCTRESRTSTHDMYRPAYHHRLAATLSNGRVAAWRHKVSGSSILARWLPPAFQKNRCDAVDGAADVVYDFPNLHVEYVRAEPPGVLTGWWRGVGANSNWFAIESFVDELAKKAGKDPVEFRRSMLDNSPRMKAVMELATSKAGWDQPIQARNGGRTGKGIGLQTAFGSYVATVTEVEVDNAGDVRVHRIVSAVDTGIVVNPDTVVAQIQGGLIFGITAALYGEVTLDKGRVQQSNFHNYRMLRHRSDTCHRGASRAERRSSGWYRGSGHDCCSTGPP
jgi:isoquinoline 1-oxidoreductase beta subunit